MMRLVKTWPFSYLSLLLLAALSVLVACKKDRGNDNSPLLLGAAVLAGNQDTTGALASQDMTAAGGAVAATQAFQHGVTSTTIASLFRAPGGDRQLALFRRGLQNPGLHTEARAIPASFACQDGSCNYAAETLSGTHTCPLGGTVKANNVQATFSSSGFPNVSSLVNGSFTFAACKVLGIDYSNYPAQKVYTITGDIAYNGSMTGQTTCILSGGTTLATANSGTLSAAASNNVTLTSTSLTVNGLTLTDVVLALGFTSMNTSLHWTRSLTQATITGTVSGTATITGTASGRSINVTKAGSYDVNQTISVTGN